jgi:hypothetical protein
VAQLPYFDWRFCGSDRQKAGMLKGEASRNLWEIPQWTLITISQ